MQAVFNSAGIWFKTRKPESQRKSYIASHISRFLGKVKTTYGN